MNRAQCHISRLNKFCPYSFDILLHAISKSCLKGLKHFNSVIAADMVFQRADTWRNNNVIITSKRHHNVVLALKWRYYYAMCPSGMLVKMYSKYTDTCRGQIIKRHNVGPQSTCVFIYTVILTYSLLKKSSAYMPITSLFLEIFTHWLRLFRQTIVIYISYYSVTCHSLRTLLHDINVSALMLVTYVVIRLAWN